jgi:hypothetical protein
MELFTGDTTVKAYTTRARAILVTLTPTRHVTFDLVGTTYGNETVAQLWMSAITAGIAAGIPTETMDNKIYLVA